MTLLLSKRREKYNIICVSVTVEAARTKLTQSDCLRYSKSWFYLSTLTSYPVTLVESLNSESSFSKTSFLTQVTETSLLYYLLIAERKRDGFMSFPKTLACSKNQTLSRIWTWLAKSIFSNDNYYTMNSNINM